MRRLRRYPPDSGRKSAATTAEAMKTGIPASQLYAFAYRLIGIPVFMASAVVTALFPRLSADSAAACASVGVLANRALRLVFFVSAPMAVGIALTARDLVSSLNLAGKFSHSAPLISILALHVPVVGMTMVLGTVLAARDRQLDLVRVGLIAALVNPLLNLFSIPVASRLFGNGAVGASVVTVLTELVMLSGTLYFLRHDEIPDTFTMRYCARCAGAVAAMGAVVLCCHALWLPARIAVGMVAYAGAALGIGTISIGDLRQRVAQMVDLVRSRTG